MEGTEAYPLPLKAILAKTLIVISKHLIPDSFLLAWHPLSGFYLSWSLPQVFWICHQQPLLSLQVQGEEGALNHNDNLYL